MLKYYHAKNDVMNQVLVLFQTAMLVNIWKRGCFLLLNLELPAQNGEQSENHFQILSQQDKDFPCF